jgi:hypothetical protein
MALPLPMPDFDASEQEWTEYLHTNLGVQFIDIYKGLIEACEKK